MRVAVAQMQSVAGDVGANLAQIALVVTVESQRGTRLLIAPELALPGYGAGAAMAGLAEPVDGPQVRALSALAARTGVALIAGFAEAAEGRVWNSAVFTDGAGPPVVYRKSHLFGAYEHGIFTAAPPATVLVTLDGLRIGLLICFDVEFPENTRRLALAGADLIAVPTALPAAGSTSRFVAETLIRTRAFENGLFVAYADQCGHDGAMAYPGLSCIAAPDGSLLAQAGAGSEVIAATLDPAAYSGATGENAYLATLRALQGL